MKSARIATLLDKKPADINGLSTNSHFRQAAEQNFKEIEDLVKKTLGLEADFLDNIQGASQQGKVLDSIKIQLGAVKDRIHQEEISEINKLVTEPILAQEEI